MTIITSHNHHDHNLRSCICSNGRRRIQNGPLSTLFALYITLFLCSFVKTTQSNEFIETNRRYDLHFNYDTKSLSGPKYWDNVDQTARDGWADFHIFEKKRHHNLDINENECDSTRRPSPINLRVNEECTDDHEILTRRIRSHNCGINDMTFEITPHLLRANMPYEDTYDENTEQGCIRPTIDLPNGLPNDWLLTWLEVHLRSEHIVDGRRYDGEIHFIHVGTFEQKTDLGIPSLFLDASGTKDHPLLQRFIDRWQGIADKVRDRCNERMKRRRRKTEMIEENDKFISPRERSGGGVDTNDIGMSFRSMLNKYQSFLPSSAAMNGRFYPREEYTGRKEDRSEPGRGVRSLTASSGYPSRTLLNSIASVQNDIADAQKIRDDEDDGMRRDARRKMFPYDLWPTIYYYRYKGSLTYPPCSEIVRWRVFDEPLVISKRQYKQMATLLSSYIDEDTCQSNTVLSSSGENVRPIQKWNKKEQIVSHCTSKDFTYWQYPEHKQ